MNQFLRDNTFLKFLSVVLAVLTWLIVINVSKPEITDSRTVTLEIRNEDAFTSRRKAWEIDRNTVAVSYHVRTDQRSKITAADFHAYVDLKNYSVTGAVPVYVEVSENVQSLVSDVSSKPSVIHISIEDMQEKRFPLQAHQKGEAAENYQVTSIQAMPDTITATGPASVIEKISSIGYVVDITGLNASKEDTSAPVFYDANGNVLSNLNNVILSEKEIYYSVTVGKKKTVPILASVTGNPALGYLYSSMTLSPNKVTVTGDNAAIDALRSIQLPDLNLDGVSDSFKKSFDLTAYLPLGVSLATPNQQVTVTVRIEKAPNLVAPQTEATESAENHHTSTESTEESESTRAGRTGPGSKSEESESTSGEETTTATTAETSRNQGSNP